MLQWWPAGAAAARGPDGPGHQAELGSRAAAALGGHCACSRAGLGGWHLRPQLLQGWTATPPAVMPGQIPDPSMAAGSLPGLGPLTRLPSSALTAEELKYADIRNIGARIAPLHFLEVKLGKRPQPVRSGPDEKEERRERPRNRTKWWQPNAKQGANGVSAAGIRVAGVHECGAENADGGAEAGAAAAHPDAQPAPPHLHRQDRQP